MPEKDPRRQEIGRQSHLVGAKFEERLDSTFAYYDATGFASVEKTPEPMKVLGRLDSMRFKACFTQKAQPDYEGTIKGGRTVMFEAKFTTKDRIEQSRVNPRQVEYMDKRQKLGARCYVLCGFMSGHVYRIPWDIWKNMKEVFGRKYVKEEDLADYQVQENWAGYLMII